MDRKTFENRATQLRPQLIKIGVAFFGNTDDAEDVAQETLLRLFTIWDRLTEEDNLTALSRRIANNYCISQQRQHKKTQPLEEELKSTDDVATRLEQQEQLSQVQRTVSHLTKGEQRIWRMWQDAGMDIRQIAAAASIDTKSVSSILSRSRKKIFEELKKNNNL